MHPRLNSINTNLIVLTQQILCFVELFCLSHHRWHLMNFRDFFSSFNFIKYLVNIYLRFVARIFNWQNSNNNVAFSMTHLSLFNRALSLDAPPLAFSTNQRLPHHSFQLTWFAFFSIRLFVLALHQTAYISVNDKKNHRTRGSVTIWAFVVIIIIHTVGCRRIERWFFVIFVSCEMSEVHRKKKCRSFGVARNDATLLKQPKKTTNRK